MIYNDNSCSECGGVRVAGSHLCADCLIMAVNQKAMLVGREKAKVVKMERKLLQSVNVMERLLDVIAEDQRYIKELRAQKNKVILSLN